MSLPNQTAYPRDATRSLAGILVPDTPIVTRAIEYAREHCDPYLFAVERKAHRLRHRNTLSVDLSRFSLLNVDLAHVCHVMRLTKMGKNFGRISANEQTQFRCSTRIASNWKS